MERNTKIREKGEISTKIHWAIQDHRESGNCGVPVGITSAVIQYSPGIPCIDAEKYEPDPSHVIDHSDLVLDKDASFEVGPVRVMDRSEKILRGKSIPLVRILWSQHGIQEETWEFETEMRSKYPELFTGMD